MKNVLITGGSGFFGGILKRRLLSEGTRVVNIDLQRDDDHHPLLTSIQGDIRNESLLKGIYRENGFDAVFHCAAILAHAVKDQNFLWTSNVDGTRAVAEGARASGVRNLVFTSSNCLWGRGYDYALTEAEEPCPIEIYGQSKWEGERILDQYSKDLNVVTLRCPTIIDFGRLGLLAILFEFVHEGRRVWTVGGGKNRYQFIYAQDLADACIRAASHSASGIFHIGSDDVTTIAQTYQYVIDHARTGARLAHLPKGPALAAMRLAYQLGLSPLGPYHYKMIAENFLFDTTKIKGELGWRPTLTNQEMLWRAYRYYHDNRLQIEARTNVSAHRRAADMGAIRVLKWMS
ncbi:MAG TPA: NAD-dependent epimerase/dehydratase family protein [Bryobacteraceae bacterium]|nr:NAD-dependent epimerase/dehydratase family protein [Bryobacteraceae bacterium]